jgi:hypothetical protein
VLIENFFCTLGIEMVQRNSWRTRYKGENALFASIDGRHSAADAGL